MTVLSYATWVNRFHADPQILGTKILLDRKPYVVIGVMPRNFEFPLVTGQLNRHGVVGADELQRAGAFCHPAAANWSYQMVGRLKPGVSPKQAQAMRSAWRRRLCGAIRR